MCISHENAPLGSSVGTRRSRCAFTLIEILAVVVILAIAALIAIPVFTGASQIQVKAAADKLAADLEYAKSMAIANQRTHKVVFDAVQESYDIWAYDGLTSTWTLITDPVKKQADFRVTYPQESRLSKVRITAADFNGTSTVQFDYTGTPRDASGNALSTGTVALESQGMTLTISVEPVTGYISIQ